METLVRTPQQVFNQPQRLAVPLFQRPYVWNEENQWEPLWSDVVRLAERLLAEGRTSPHFLGAVVFQQPQNATGSLQERSIIDGQQRLTTLQLLLDALHAELLACGATQQAKRIESLVRNDEAFCERPEDQFKVWPTNRDRPAFNGVMSAAIPVDYDSLANQGRLVDAHKYFAERAREWLNAGGEDLVLSRATGIEKVVRECLQIVVIDLNSDENAQEIFETLNARGAQLTAADLIKNLVFQRLFEAGADVEAVYEKSWKEFETGFWETEVSYGRLRYTRSSIFLNHWLIAQTGEEIVAREVFTRFKRFVQADSLAGMPALLERLRRSANVYRSFIETSDNLAGSIDRIGMFAYRTATLDSDVFKPALLLLLDPEQQAIPPQQLHRALESLEGWLVRRMLVRGSTNGYNKLAADLVKRLRESERVAAGDVVATFFSDQRSASSYLPDDAEIQREVTGLSAYTRLQRGRLRMLLEAIEDHRRGWKGNTEAFGGQRVPRGKLAIEHIMPQSWQTNWPIGESNESQRDATVQSLGNLTLLTGKLNSKVSNGPWTKKREALKEHDVLKLNMELLDRAGEAWTEQLIANRTSELIGYITEIWPAPQGHISSFVASPRQDRRRTTIADLIGAGLLESGATLYPRKKRIVDVTATVLSDGGIDVAGVRYTTPSGAASSISGGSENGWWFFLLTPTGRRSLSDLWHEYRNLNSVDAETDEPEMPEEGDDE
jgi:Protein of unknown function DUF262/Protein of unknown function (DUF1524)/Restriction Enzyme Adenine Methylase Associated